MRKSRLLLMLICIASVAACQGAVRSAGEVDITGIYYLYSVDGAAVPGIVTHDGVQMRVDSGTLIISDGGSCYSRSRFTPPGGVEFIREVEAKYVREGSRLIMSWEGAGVTEATLDGDVLVMDNHGSIFEYTRNPD